MAVPTQGRDKADQDATEAAVVSVEADGGQTLQSSARLSLDTSYTNDGTNVTPLKNPATLPSSTPQPSPRSLLRLQSTPKSRPWDAESGALLAREARQIMQAYLGLVVEGDATNALVAQLGIEWTERARREKTAVFACMLPGNVWQAYLTVTSFQASRDAILELLLDDSRICEFDELFDSFRPIVRVDACTSVRRMAFKAIWPTSPRDFLVLTTSSLRPDGTALIASRSASNTLEPPVPGFVRGFIQATGYYIQPYETLSEAERRELPFLAPGGCRVSFIVHSELGGSLPVSVINMLGINAPIKMMSAIDHIVSRPQKGKRSK